MLDEWGTTDDGYIANSNGEVFFLRNDIGSFDKKITPAKAKYKIRKTDTHIHCKGELVPDKDVVLVYEDNDSVSFSEPDGSVFKDYEREWYGSAYIKTPDGEAVDIRLYDTVRL